MKLFFSSCYKRFFFFCTFSFPSFLSFSCSKSVASQWLLVYVPVEQLHSSASLSSSVVASSETSDHDKIYSKIASDFYIEKVGDRSVYLSLNKQTALTNTTTLKNDNKTYEKSIDHLKDGFNTDDNGNGRDLSLNMIYSMNGIEDLILKIKESILKSFQLISHMYDIEIRKLDAFRGGKQFDFRNFVLIKESLALLYQTLGLEEDALRLYDELEALLDDNNQAIPILMKGILMIHCFTTILSLIFSINIL